MLPERFRFVRFRAVSGAVCLASMVILATLGICHLDGVETVQNLALDVFMVGGGSGVRGTCVNVGCFPVKLYMHLGEGCAEAQGLGWTLQACRSLKGGLKSRGVRK